MVIYVEKKNQLLKQSSRRNKKCWSHIAQRNQNCNVQYPSHLHQERDTCSNAVDHLVHYHTAISPPDFSEEIIEKWKSFCPRGICKQFEWISKKQRHGYYCILLDFNVNWDFYESLQNLPLCLILSQNICIFLASF